jgi:uncharacterized protein YuzE
MVNGRSRMQVTYNDKTDILYIRLESKKQEVINHRVGKDVVLDIGEGEKIVGIEIQEASKRIPLESVFPIKYKMVK